MLTIQNGMNARMLDKNVYSAGTCEARLANSVLKNLMQIEGVCQLLIIITPVNSVISHKALCFNRVIVSSLIVIVSSLIVLFMT